MTTQFTLIIGLNDKDSKKQEITNEFAMNKMFELLIKQGFDGGTLTAQQGFYKHDDGQVVFENSIKVELLFCEQEKVEKLAYLCKKTFNQESIGFVTTKIKSELK